MLNDWVRIKNKLAGLRANARRGKFMNFYPNLKNAIKEIKEISAKYDRYTGNEGKDVIYFMEDAYRYPVADSSRQKIIHSLDKAEEIHNRKPVQEYFR